MLVSTDKKYVIAIETALASVSQNIVTANENDAKLKTLALIIKFGHDLFDGKDVKSIAAAAVSNSCTDRFFALAERPIKHTNERYATKNPPVGADFWFIVSFFSVVENRKKAPLQG